MAAHDMLAFTKVAQDYPTKRPAEERDDDFLEIARPFIVEKAEEQASRCSQCGVPFCQVHCPLHQNIPDWLMLTAENRLREAYDLAAATSTMPEVCGRICPQDRLCEGNCVIEQSGHGAVTIGSVEKFITEKAWEEGLGRAGPPDSRPLAPLGRHHRRRPGRADGGGAAAAARLQRHRLRPARPGRRPAHLRHTRLQAGEICRRAAAETAGGRRHRVPLRF